MFTKLMNVDYIGYLCIYVFELMLFFKNTSTGTFTSISRKKNHQNKPKQGMIGM